MSVIPGYIHPRQTRGSESSNQVGIKPDALITDALTQEGPGAVMVAHALRSEGADASEDGTGRGTPIVIAEALDVPNLRVQPDETSGTLQGKKSGGYSLNYQNPVFTIQHAQIGRKDDAGPQGKGYQENIAFTVDSRPVSDVIAFSSKDHGGDAGELSPTLRAQNFDKSHINGGGQVAIAFAENQRGEVRTSDVSPQLSCTGGKPGSGYSATAGNFGVRRLTPRECERLQSFPDDFTRWDAEGKEISDSARYRMLGNAVAVNVSKWIGRRIVSIHRAERSY
jgi:DNA (cytosine-5)-methyltransferase 1